MGGKLGETYAFRPVYNVGEPEHPLIDDLDDHPELRYIFPGEKIWDVTEFCGGLKGIENKKCCDSVGEKCTLLPERLLEAMGFYAGGYEIGRHRCFSPVYNINTAREFELIQDAINDEDTREGDMILVYPGNRTENVDVTKGVTIMSLWTNPEGTVVKARDPNDHVFDVQSDDVSIIGLAATGATGDYAAGIYLHEKAHCILSDNIVSNNYWGISLEESDDNGLSRNTANSNTHDGIYLKYSFNNTLSDNVANLNFGPGILLADSDNNNLWRNSARENFHGIWLIRSSENDLLDNTAYNNTQYGIYLDEATNNEIRDNSAGNNDFGIRLHLANDNMLSDNRCYSNNADGIWLQSSRNNTITGGTVNSNDGRGIYLFWSNDNLIYNNWFDNEVNAWDNGINAWNTTKEDGPNIVLGPYLGGNYWSDYDGEDTDGDGLGNTLLPYNSSGNISNEGCGDYLPLPRPVRNVDKGTTYRSIQEAIDDSQPYGRDTIMLSPGTYREDVVVDNPVTITSASGNPEDTIVYAQLDAFRVKATNVTIKDLGITGYWAAFGIWLLPDASQCTLEGNRCTGLLVGIEVCGNNNTILGNACCCDDQIGYGIRLDDASDNTISDNTCLDGEYGIYLYQSSQNTLSDNICSGNAGGISLSSSDSNIIVRNTDLDNDTGILLRDSMENNIYLNDFISSGANVYSEDSSNIWNSPYPITYLYDEWSFTNRLGNHWSDYTGADADGDGIGDTAYGGQMVVAAGGHQTVGCKSDGTVVAVGRNDYGQRDVGSWTGIVQVAEGNDHTVGRKGDGTVVAVGYNASGQCDVGGWTGIVQVDAGYYHTVGLKSDGTVVAVGDNSYGQRDVGDWMLLLETTPLDSYPLVAPPENYEIGSNSPPNTPGNLSPANHATDVRINTCLAWTGGDPDADQVVDYDVYLGTNYPPPLWETIGPYPGGQSLITYDPGTLVSGMTYYWRIVTRDMYGTSREGPILDFTTEQIEFQLALKAGWNMVSMPVAPADNSVSAVFPGAAGVFAWNGTSRSYYVPTVIDPEKGYWLAVTQDTTIAVDGAPVRTWTIGIKAAWNMIGSVNTTAGIADPNDDPDGSVIPPAYAWDPAGRSYVLTTDIEPGKGYWIPATEDCVLTLWLTFPDANLEAAIREVIGKPTGEIYESDLEWLTHLDASRRDIANVAGLEHCTSLTELDLPRNQISHFWPLANLTNLTWLRLDDNQISDIAPLGYLTNLTDLWLRGNVISDISPLANLTSLISLWLAENQISDIWPLTNLTSLTELYLDRNQISDISFLVQNAGLGEGDEVWLEDNPLSWDSINIYIPQLEARGVFIMY